MTFSVNKETSLQQPLTLTFSDTSTRTGKPVISPAPSSSSSVSALFKKIEVIETPPKPWSEVVSELIVEVRGTGCTPALLAAFEDVIKANRLQINQLSEMEGTVFHLLAKYGSPVEFVKILVKYGIDFSIQDVYGNTPLMWAIANAHNAMAREILNHLPLTQRYSLNKQSSVYHGNSALHLLIAKGYTTTSIQGHSLACSNFELLQRAVALGANVNIADAKGNTPLHLAYLRRDAQMIKFLLGAGANRDQLNGLGQKPIQLARLSDGEDLNFAIAKEILSSSAGGRFFDFIERDYKNADNLRAILSL